MKTSKLYNFMFFGPQRETHALEGPGAFSNEKSGSV